MKYFYAYLLASLLLIDAGQVLAQQEFTLQLMDNLHQSTYVNPAIVPKNNINISLLSSYQLGITNTGFSYNQLAAQIEEGESGQPILNLESMLHNMKLDRKHYLNMSGSIDLLSVGFKAGKGRFSLNLSERVHGRMYYDDAILRAAVYGNTPEETIRINNYTLNALHYHEAGIGYNRKILADDRLVVGGRLKVLMGLGNIDTKKAEVALTTGSEAEMYALTMQTDILVRSSGLNLLENGRADQYIANTSNLGFGADLGATYKLDTRWSFGASLVNIGFINWKSNNVNRQSQGAYTFTGINSDSLFTSGSFDVNTTQMLDSISETFKFTETSEAYYTGIPAQMYLTAYYQLASRTTASAMINTSFIGSGFQKGLALGIRQDVGRWLQASATYSMQARSYNNLGFGLAINSGRKGLQLYMVSDNILAALNPGGAKTASIRTGFNFAF